MKRNKSDSLAGRPGTPIRADLSREDTIRSQSIPGVKENLRPLSPKGCPLDTDGDGNCFRHPQGCPQ